MQRCSSLAVNAVALGPQGVTKTSVMHEEGLLPLMALVDGNDQVDFRNVTSQSWNFTAI